MNRRLLALAMLLPASTVSGHHSVSAYFDTSQVIEVQGELTEVRWRNPHVGFTINVLDENGQETSWEISGTSLSHLGRLGLTADMFTIGEVVTFAGSPSRRPIPALQTSNVLMSDGDEIALNTTGRRHWSAGTEELLRVTPADVAARDDGDSVDRSLFRVWSTPTRGIDRDAIWEGETLVVNTTLSTWPYFDGQGIPISAAAEYEERFTVSDDGKRLNYTVLVTDSTTFTEPVLLDRFWLWVPGVQVERYDCTL